MLNDSWWYAFLTMFPGYMFAAYVQAKGEYRVMSSYKGYLPPELASTIAEEDAFVQGRCYKMFLLIVVYNILKYMI